MLFLCYELLLVLRPQASKLDDALAALLEEAPAQLLATDAALPDFQQVKCDY